MKLEMIDSTEYTVGNTFKSRGGSKVMLCAIGWHEVMLICDDGNRWTDEGRLLIPEDKWNHGHFHIPNDSPFWGTEGRQDWTLIKKGA